MKRKEKRAEKPFKIAVEATPDVAGGYRAGLEAFGNYKSKIKVKDTSKIDGSLDIDGVTKELYPEDPRWDFALSYDDEVFYIEIHPATSGEVSKMVSKLKWLKNWLENKAPEINKMTAKSRHPFYWVQSSGCNIPKHTPQYKTMVQNKICPMPVWDYAKISKKE